MSNGGSPTGGSDESPLVLALKTRSIGRTSWQTTLINEAPLMGSLSRRGGAPNKGHLPEPASGPTPAEKVLPTPTPKSEDGGSTKANDHPLPQTSFHQSNPPPPTFSPKSEDGGPSKISDHPLPQTSFHQSNFPAPNPTLKSEDGGLPKTSDRSLPQTSFHQSNSPRPFSTTLINSPSPQSTSEAGHSAKPPVESNIPQCQLSGDNQDQHNASGRSNPGCIPGHGDPTPAEPSTTVNGLPPVHSPPNGSTTSQTHTNGFPPDHGSHTTTQFPPVQSFTDNKHSLGQSQTPIQSFTDNEHSLGQPQTPIQSFTDIKHSLGHSQIPTQSRTNNPFPVQSHIPSESHTHDSPFPIRSHSNRLPTQTQHSESRPLNTQTPPVSIHATTHTDSPVFQTSKEPSTESHTGKPGRHTSGLFTPPSQNHPSDTRSPLITTKAQPDPEPTKGSRPIPEIPLPISHFEPSAPPSSTARSTAFVSHTDKSHSTPPPQSHPEPSRFTTKAAPPPISRLPGPIHLSKATPPSQHTDKPQPVPPSKSSAEPSPHTTKATPLPLIPLPIHTSKGHSAPTPITTKAAPPQRPDQPQPTQPQKPPVEPSRPTTKADPPPNTVKSPVNVPPPTHTPESPFRTETFTNGPVTASPTNVPGPSETSILNLSFISRPVPVTINSKKPVNLVGSITGSQVSSSQDTGVPTSPSIDFTSSNSNPPITQGSTISTNGSTNKPEHTGPNSKHPGGQHQSPSNHKSSSTAAIVGGVLGAVVALVILAFVIIGFCFYRRKLRKTQKKLQLYEKDGDAAPPLYVPFGSRAVHDPRVVYEHPSSLGSQNMQALPVPSVPMSTNPFSDLPSTYQVNDVNRALGDQNMQALPVPSVPMNTNPFFNLPSTYQVNDVNRAPVSEKDTNLAKDLGGASAYHPAEESLTGGQHWVSFRVTSPPKVFNPHLSKSSTDTTLSVDSMDAGKKSSSSSWIDDLDLNGSKDFDPAKMVKAPNAPIGVAV